MAPAVVCTVIVSSPPSPGVGSRGDAVQAPDVAGADDASPDMPGDPAVGAGAGLTAGPADGLARGA